MRLSRRRSIVSIVAVLLLISIALAWKPASITYHRSRMAYYHQLIFEKETSDEQEWFGYLFEYEVSASDRLEYHREQLRRWGALSRIDYSFQHVNLLSYEWRHLQDRILANQCPAYDRHAGVSVPLCGEVIKMKIWCAPGQEYAWQEFLQSVDIADYDQQYMKEDSLLSHP